MAIRIGVTSDTHVTGVYREIPEALWRGLEGCDRVIHAGDFDRWETFEEFKRRFPLTGVIGNRDTFPVSEDTPESTVIEVGGFRIGVTHGFGPRKGIPQRILRCWEGGEVDLLVFGHSHEAGIHLVEGVRFLNPGSPTDILTAERQTYAILCIDNSIEIEIHDLSI